MTNEEYQASVIEDLKRMISEKNQRINELGEGANEYEIQLQLRLNQIFELRARVDALIEENKQLTRDLEMAEALYVQIIHEGNIEIGELKKELRKRWERIEELGKKVDSLNVEIINLNDIVRDIQPEIGKQRTMAAIWGSKVEKLSKALEFYSDKDNLEKYIREVYRYRPDDPDYAHIETSLYDEVTKIAEEALK